MSKIELINGSSVEQVVDAIVNASNKYLISGGGVCGAIFEKAGYIELNNECSKYKTPLKVGSAVITSAFNIKNAKYIIHAVGPDFNVKPNAFDELYEAYYNSLVVLKDNKLHSISFPLISSGIFGGKLENPVQNSVIQCLKAYNQFTNDFKNYDIDVKLCAFTTNEMLEAKKAFEQFSL